MFVQSVAPVWSKALCDALLNALTAVPLAPLLNAPNVHLFKNNTVFGPSTLLSGLTESDFPGYAIVAMGALAGPVTLTSLAEAKYVDADFACNAAPSPAQIVYGYYVTDGTNLILYAGETFPIPVNIASPGDFVSLELIWPEARLRSAA